MFEGDIFGELFLFGHFDIDTAGIFAGMEKPQFFFRALGSGFKGVKVFGGSSSLRCLRSLVFAVPFPTWIGP